MEGKILKFNCKWRITINVPLICNYGLLWFVKCHLAHGQPHLDLLRRLVTWHTCGTICGSCCLQQPKPQRGYQLFVGGLSLLVTLWAEGPKKAECIMGISTDCPEWHQRGLFWPVQGQRPLRCVCVWVLSAGFSHLSTPDAKWAVCVGHTVATLW